MRCMSEINIMYNLCGRLCDCKFCLQIVLSAHSVWQQSLCWCWNERYNIQNLYCHCNYAFISKHLIFSHVHVFFTNFGSVDVWCLSYSVRKIGSIHSQFVTVCCTCGKIMGTCPLSLWYMHSDKKKCLKEW